MSNNNHREPEYHDSNIFGVLVGLLIGCLAGAVTMLLLAPQSGEDTRKQIQEKGIELRDRTAGLVDDVMSEVRADSSRISARGRQTAQELLHHGQDLVVEQLDRVSAAAQVGKKAIQNS